jgi:hypothetical protein
MSEERVAQMIGRLSSAFTREPGSNIEKLVRVTEAELQDIADAAAAVLQAHQYENATGASLDHFARIYGVTRVQTDTDADVRHKITVAASVRESCGTVSDILALVERITGYAIADIDLIEFESTIPEGGYGKQEWGTTEWGGRYPTAANFRLMFHGSGVSPGFAVEDLVDGINRVRCAGVTFNASATIFELDDNLIVTVTPINDHIVSEGEVLGESYGWGNAGWGSRGWGGFYVKVSIGATTATQIT